MAMTLPAANERNYENPPAGQYIGICTQLVDLGTQPQSYMGQPKAPARQVRFTFELHASDANDVPITMLDGRPYTVNSYDMTLNTGDKANFRKFLESWRGKAFSESEIGPGGTFDLLKCVGVYGMISVVEYTKKDGSIATGLGTVVPLYKGIARPAQVNPRICFAMTPEDFDPEVLTKLSAKLQEKIKASPEYKALTSGDGGQQAAHDAAFAEAERQLENAARLPQHQMPAPAQRPTASAQPQQTSQQKAAYAPPPVQQNAQQGQRLAPPRAQLQPIAQYLDDDIPFAFLLVAGSALAMSFLTGPASVLIGA